MTEKIEQLKLTKIVKNPYQPRLTFDEEKLTELAQSIAENGVLQPIIVRKSQLIGYELLAGERRFQASKLAGISTIPAIIREYSDQEMMTLSILENLQRENLNPIEEARSLAQLAEKLALTHEEIGKKLGKSRSYVSNTIRILSLPSEILQHIENGEISSAHGRTLLAEKNISRQIELSKRIISDKLSVRELEKLIYGKEKTMKTNQNIFIAETEKELMKLIGNTVKIRSNKHYQGTISFKFDTLDEFEALIHLLKK